MRICTCIRQICMTCTNTFLITREEASFRSCRILLLYLLQTNKQMCICVGGENFADRRSESERPNCEWLVIMLITALQICGWYWVVLLIAHAHISVAYLWLKSNCWKDYTWLQNRNKNLNNILSSTLHNHKWCLFCIFMVTGCESIFDSKWWPWQRKR